MRASVLTPFVDITPGESVEVQLEVINTLEIVDLISVAVPGLRPDEVHFDRESVSLFPDETAIITMTLKLRPTFPAGPGLLEVRIASNLRPELVELRTVEIDVAPFAAAELVVSPQSIVAKSKLTMYAVVANTGNTALNVSLLAKDDQRHLNFHLTPPSLVLAPETEREVVIDGKGRRPFFGSPAFRTVYISAESEAGLLDDSVNVTQRPVLVRGLLTALILAAIIALWALIVTFGVDLVLSSEPAPKAIPSDFIDPVSYATLAEVGSAGAVGGGSANSVQAILGSMSGEVVGADNGEPIPRLAVEAHRRTRDAPDAALGSPETLVQSAATDENGVFVIDGIFPGTYFLKLVGPGFEDSWYPGVPNAGDAAPVMLEAGDEFVLAAAVPVSGLPGTITGSIDTGDLTAPLTVVVRPLVNDVPGFEVARVEVVAPDLDADGFAEAEATYAVTGLATPLTYSISVDSDTFADQVIVETLGAGESLEAAPIRLVPGDGGVLGTIFLEGPPPTDGVTVTATAGDTSFTLTTPPPVIDTDAPARSVVEFLFDGLPTPDTYRLDFEAPGFEPTSTSVDVTAGTIGDAGEVVLTGGSRTFGGTVLDATTGLRLGDVAVTIEGSEGEIATATLPAPTEPGAVGLDCRTPPAVPVYEASSGAGTFTFDNLPLGLASVTFSKPGYTSITHRIDVTGDGSPETLTSGIEDRVVELTPTVGEVCGTVTDGSGVGIAGGEVLLRGGPPGDDGTFEERMPTPTASEPPGAYKIADMEAGEYTLTATAEGYDPCTVVLRILPGSRAVRLLVVDLQLVLSSADDDVRCTITEGAP